LNEKENEISTLAESKASYRTFYDEKLAGEMEETDKLRAKFEDRESRLIERDEET